MKIIKYLIFTFLIVSCFNVKAVSKSCDKSEYSRLKELAKKVDFDYDYKVKDRVATFSITAINLNQDLKVRIIEDYYKNKFKEFKDNSSHSATIDGFLSGQKVEVTITGFVPNRCSGEVLLKKVIKLPYYNYYYSPDRCKGNEDFKYCRQLITDNINESKFEKEFFTYIKKKVESQKKTTVTQEDNTTKYIIIGVVGVVVALGAIVLITRSISKIRKRNSL